MTGERDLLQILANPTNRAILQMLYAEPQYPRRLAELVGLTEDEVSRRLRSLERLGVVEASWTNVGKNVRLYRLATSRFSVEVGASGLRVAGAVGDLPLPVAAEAVPETPRFVGREVELAELDRLAAGRAGLCLTGIGGTGKTTLAAAWARQSGRAVAWHTVAPGETGPVLLAGLATALRALDSPEEVRRLSALRGGDDAAGLATALADRLDALSAVAVVDRFEAASPDAAEAIATIARRLTRGRLLLTSRVFPRSVSRDALATFRVGGLSAQATAELLSALGAQSTAAGQVHRATAGHPLSVVLAAPVLAGGGAPTTRLGQEAGIQAFVVDELLPQLSEPERDALLQLSVLRLPFSTEEAEQVTGSRHAAHTLLRLESRSLVGRAGEQYFLHDLVRSFATEAVPERRAVHARAARALLASREPRKAVEAIHHLVEAGQTAAAVAVLREEAERRTYRFAEVGLADAYLEVVDRLVRRLDLEPSLRAVVELECGSVLTQLGRRDEAEVQLDACTRHLGAAERPTALERPLLFARSRLHRIRGEVDAATALCERIERLAEAAGDGRDLLDALADHAFDEENRSDAAALRLYERAIAAAPPDADPRTLALVYAGASRVAARWKDPRFESWAGLAVELSRVSGSLRAEASVYANLASHHVLAGTPGMAVQYAQQYLEVANRLGDPWMRCCALTDMAFLRASQGEGAEALRCAEECAGVAASLQSRFFDLAASVAAAEALHGLGRSTEALARIEPRLGPPYRSFPGLLERGWRVVAAARMALADESGARDASLRAERLRKEHGLSTSPTALFVAVRPDVQPKGEPVRRRRAPRRGAAPAFLYECPLCGQDRPLGRLPRTPPECCGTPMRLAAPAAPPTPAAPKVGGKEPREAVGLRGSGARRGGS